MANAKLDIEIAGFVSNINTAKGQLKGLNAEMKNADAEFKATGNAEKALADKTKTLNSQLQVQKNIATQAQQALKAMEDAGIKPTDQAYQKLYATMMNAQAGMNEAQAALKALSSSEQTAAQSADGLATSVQSIGKKMSLDQVISGIDRITDGLESAAKKAINLGEKIWNSFMDTASWSDDVATMADRMGLTTEQVQKMRVVADEFEAPVEAMAKTWKKVKTNMASDSDEVKAAFEAVGVSVETVMGQGKYGPITQARDYMDVFWEIGDALMNMSDASEQEQLAQKLLGRSWDEMIPLFKKGREAYESAMDSVTVADDEAIQNNAALKDSVSALEEQFNIFKSEVLGSISPELTKVTESFSGLLGAITEYAKSDEGQELLGKIGTAIEGLIDDIAKIEPEKVVSGFVSVVETLKGALQWIVDNKDLVSGALGAIVAGWAGLTLTGGALQVLKLIEGLQGLGLIGGGATAGGASGIGASAAGVAITGALSSVLPNVASWSSVNGGPVLDWFIHESPLAPVFNGIESMGDWWERQKSEFQERADSFGDNWDPNSPDANILMQNAKNNILYWDMIHKQQQEAQEWNFGDHMSIDEIEAAINGEGPVKVEVEPEIPENWDFGDHMSIDEIMKRINGGKPVDVPADLDNETTAEDIEKEVGTVNVPAILDWRPSYMQGYVPQLPGPEGHANGLPFVPYDNYLARLHRGERVLTANQNRHYTYNSNNYFGNVNLNNGQDIEALCNSIDRHNRRQRSGYGS